MTTYTPSFTPQEFELRNYTNPYFDPEQLTKTLEIEGRVEGQLDFVAQMLGWNGPNYWSSLTSTVSEKRQLLGGTFGVYNSFIIPRIYEVRNWDNTIMVDRLQFLQPNRQTYVERVILGEDIYQIRSVTVEGDKYIISFGTLPQSFYDQIAANVPLKVDIPTYRPAPFRRNLIGVSGDNRFICGASGSQLSLYPEWDTEKQFPYLFPILFTDAVYYFNQPVYLVTSSSPSVTLYPEYDQDAQAWYIKIPGDTLKLQAGVAGTLIWSYSDSTSQVDVSLDVKIENWVDPSDWVSNNVLENYKGAWNNKGGPLPFNLVFDSLSIHGVNEQNSIYLGPITRTLSFNNLVNLVYAQQTPTTLIPPGTPQNGELWWSIETEMLSEWDPDDTNCKGWVPLTYRNLSTPLQPYLYVFPTVAAFSAGAPLLPPKVSVQITDITGLGVAQNVIGVQGTLSSPGSLILYRANSGPYWTPTSFTYATLADFNEDADLLPFEVPVTVTNADGLQPWNNLYSVENLKIAVSGEYTVILTKYYQNTTWNVSTPSPIQYVADSSLFSTSGYKEGEMWWDFGNPNPNTRAAAIYYQSAWIPLNAYPQTGPPAPTLDMGVVLFYVNGELLSNGVPHFTQDYSVLCTSNPTTGEYEIIYTPITYLGKTQFPSITVSDSLTTTYRANVSELIFGGLQYKLSPNVYDAETPLRLWKASDLQVVETLAHLEEDNYINPLRADINTGPGPENWERYFIRLPLDYGRNGDKWQKVALTCQNFAYWGSSSEPEKMQCPPEDDVPVIYEELFLYDQPVQDYTYVYCEAYLYSNIAYSYNVDLGNYRNAGIFPAIDIQFDEFTEAELIDYEPLHNRIANVTSPVNQGYGDWVGEYVNINPCVPLTGFFTTDLLNNGISPVAAPIWDASIYKFAPTCENDEESYSVDVNHYKIGYCYFVADASTAEDGFFDPQQEIAWRYPVEQARTGYLTPR